MHKYTRIVLSFLCALIGIMAVYEVPLQPLPIADNWRMAGALAVVIIAVLNYRFLFGDVR